VALRQGLRKCVVFDLDGTLVDSSQRYRLCAEESAGDRTLFWLCFQSPRYMHLDAPRWDIISIARALKEQGYRIVIVSGRNRAAQLQATLEQLREWGIPFDRLILREQGDFRKDYVYKYEVLRKLLTDGECESIEAVYDDSQDVYEQLSKAGFRVIRVVGPR